MRWYDRIDTLPDSYITKKLKEFFQEDFPEGDVSSNPIFSTTNKNITGRFKARQDLIFCGTPILENAFRTSELKLFFKDGDKIKKGTTIAEITGKASEILTLERSILNLLQRLSGISTLTRQYVDAVDEKISILDTRKTTPGLRLFEKYAVHCGGGRNHRLDLSSGIMLKDNHLAACDSLEQAIQLCRTHNPNLILEVEIDSQNQLPTILNTGVDAILLDNMNAKTAKNAVKIIRNHSSGKDIFIEASGNITLKTVASYVNTGINAVSVGALTHSAPAVDIGLDF